jgi:transcriptional regulator with XRE-family HTH domain
VSDSARLFARGREARAQKITNMLYLTPMVSALLIREARKRALLTQAQLAQRLGVPQPQIARWESGRAAPSFERLGSVVAACGLDLTFSLATRDQESRQMLALQKGRTPDELVDQLTAWNALHAELAR